MALEANERQTGVDRRQLSSHYRSHALAPIFFSAVALRLQTHGWVCTIVCAYISGLGDRAHCGMGTRVKKAKADRDNSRIYCFLAIYMARSQSSFCNTLFLF
jgi:hypothetical protein